MPLNRRSFLKSALLGAVAFAPAARLLPAAEPAAPFQFDPNSNLIPAPQSSAQWEEFRRQLREWREAKQRALRYSDALYRHPEFAWSSANFSCCFLFMFDPSFYDAHRRKYRVRELLERGKRQFGGYDSVVLWHAYPRIGLDDRNQFDFYRDMPGGLPGLRRVVQEFHAAGVKVYVDYNPWDQKTRREGKEDTESLAELVGAIAADGIFLDTMSEGVAQFRNRLDAVRSGVVLEGEGALPLERIHDHHASWAQHFEDAQVPGVLRNKWFERRHMQHQIERWSRDHTAELHQAWMNGSGILVWENVFGAWVGWNARDCSILRTMLPIQRHFAALFSGEGWTPLIRTLRTDVYASLWSGKGVRLWTLMNRSQETVTGELVTIERKAGESVWDLVKGRPAACATRGSETVLSGAIRPRGIGCFVALAGKPDAGLARLLRQQAATEERATWDTTFPGLEVRLRPPGRSRALAASAVPASMAIIPAVSKTLEVEFRTRECGFYDSGAVHRGPGFPNLHGPARFQRQASLRSYAIDRTPVTNAEYAAFLKAAGYRPPITENFLKHWSEGRPPAGKEDHPVVYVDLDDARAYARWAGKRLPSEEEWQYGAQGNDGRDCPWGERMEPGRCNDGATGGTTGVRSFPKGRSPFGLFDMCGNVWQWTESERTGGRTRFAILRGGSYYRRGGSDWYFDEGAKPVWFAAKMLLLWPGLDRCANIGFRCVADLV